MPRPRLDVLRRARLSTLPEVVELHTRLTGVLHARRIGSVHLDDWLSGCRDADAEQVAAWLERIEHLLGD